MTIILVTAIDKHNISNLRLLYFLRSAILESVETYADYDDLARLISSNETEEYLR